MEQIWDIPDFPPEPPEPTIFLTFSQIRDLRGQITITGDITMYKGTFGADIDVTIQPKFEDGSDAPYEAGSEKVQFKAMYPDDGSDASAAFTVSEDFAGTGKVRVKHSGEQREAVGLLTIDVDVDTDTDEEEVKGGILDIVIDSPNASRVELTATEHVDSGGEPTPEPV